MKIEIIKNGKSYINIEDLGKLGVSTAEIRFIKIVMSVVQAYEGSSITINLDHTTLMMDIPGDMEAQAMCSMAIEDAVQAAGVYYLLNGMSDMPSDNIKTLKHGIGWVI